MKVLHLIGGGDEGGAKSHVLSLVQQLGNHISVKLISLRPGPFAEDAKKMGIDVEVIHTGNIFKDISLVRKIIENGRYDILHTHGAKANMIGVFMKKQTKIPVVSTIHSDYRLDYLNSIWKMYTFGLINTVSLRFLDYYVAVSNNFREMLIKRGFPPQRIYTVYNGIPFDKPVDIMPPEDFAKKYGFPIQPGDIFIGILASARRGTVLWRMFLPPVINLLSKTCQVIYANFSSVVENGLPGKTPEYLVLI